MRLVEIVPRRFHGISQELAKFGTIGLINVVVNFAVVNLLLVTVFRGSEVKANIVAVVVAATSAYFMNRHWTYRDRPRSTLHREYLLFFFFNFVGLVIQASTVAFTKYVLHETHILALNISTGVGIGLGTLFRFWAYRTHVFKLELPAPSRPTFEPARREEPEPTDVEVPAADDETPAEPAPARGLRLVVTSSPGGSVVIKVVDSAEEIDEIDLDDSVRASP